MSNILTDEFLSQFREMPRADFGQQLQARLKTQRRPLILVNPLLTRRALAGLASMLLVGSTILAASPQARAAVQTTIFEVSGFIFEVVGPMTPGTKVEIQTVDSAEIEAMKQDGRLKVMQVPTAPLAAPAWIPKEYQFKSELLGMAAMASSSITGTAPINVTSGDSNWQRTMLWRDASGAPLLFQLRQGDADATLSNSSGEAVAVGGQTGTLSHGLTREQLVLEQPIIEDVRNGSFTQLRWVSDNTRYVLVAPDGSLSDADLIRMAESVK